MKLYTTLFSSAENINKEKTIVRLVVFTLVWLVFFTPSAHSEIFLNFGLYASDKPTVIIKKFRPVLNYLEDVLQEELNEAVNIRIQIASSYEKGINALATGKVDFARFGPASYIKVKERNNKIRIMAIESKNGHKRFKGIICIHADSTILSVDELKGKSFAFGNKLSTIGRYLSQQYLVEHGIQATDLSRHAYLGRHDKVGYAVGRKRYDAGALKDSTFEKLKQKGLPIKALAEFPNVTQPWIASSTLNEKIFLTLQKCLLKIHQEELLNPLTIDGFIVGSDSDYAMIRKAILKNDSFFHSY